MASTAGPPPRGGRGPTATFRLMTKPSCPFRDASHQPLLHLPTSTVVPFGISVNTSLLVPAVLRRLGSEATAIGFAHAHTADSTVKMATDAAILTTLMALLVLLSRPWEARFNVRHSRQFK